VNSEVHSTVEPAMERDPCNRRRYVQGAQGGHYESYFLRANHPERPLAFWIRYTIFSPKGRPSDALGEVWAICFDGEAGRITGVKEALPLSSCRFSETGLDVRVGSAVLTEGRLEGRASSRGNTLQWALQYEGHDPPLLLLPRSFYERRFPRAKALVATPNATFHGVLTVNGEAIRVEQWRGSQNHNWGSRHTDSYAWGQVAGFDNAPDAFLECSTARLRLGPLWTPPLSLIVLRTQGREVALNGLSRALHARGRFDFFDWRVDSHSSRVRVSVHMHASPSAFVGLNYANPPGGTKTCLHTQLATCELILEEVGQPPRTYTTMQRAAFEILSERQDHGIAIVA
jgi:hypothetical protein